MHRAVGAWAVIVLLATGCGPTVVGRPLSVTAAPRILPSEAQMTGAVGNPLSTFGFPPMVGGVEILPDGYRTDADATPIACAAVTDTAPRRVYQPLPVMEVARQSFFNWNPGVAVSGVDTAVIRLADSDVTQAAMRRFSQQWTMCANVTVVKHVHDTVLDAAITDVRGRDAVVSATVRSRQRPQAPVLRFERVLAARGTTMVEVSMALAASSDPKKDYRAVAERVAEVMLAASQ